MKSRKEPVIAVPAGPAKPAQPTKPANVGETQWWSPERHADRRGFLVRRGQIRTNIRNYFTQKDFTEVECSILQTSPGNETHLHGYATQRRWDDGQTQELYLHTSPEFACKKLLAAGEQRIFDFARVFRNREEGPLHAPEFTMLEWYRVAEPYDQLMTDCQAIVTASANSALQWRDARCDPQATAERLSVTQACKDYAGIDLDTVLNKRDGFAQQAVEAGLTIEASDTWSDIFSKVLVRFVEPRLGQGQMTFLDRYPICEAALARPCEDDARFAERFELYACGVELANGFGELTDPIEQRKRFEADMDEKQRLYNERYPIDNDFLAAMAHMPPASGCALGFDRLVMLATGANSINDVLWTPPITRSETD